MSLISTSILIVDSNTPVFAVLLVYCTVLSLRFRGFQALVRGEASRCALGKTRG